jgi:AcrR family transcriptional regulator
VTVRIERQGAVTTVIIDRPAARNAIDRATAQALAEAFPQTCLPPRPPRPFLRRRRPQAMANPSNGACRWPKHCATNAATARCRWPAARPWPAPDTSAKARGAMAASRRPLAQDEPNRRAEIVRAASRLFAEKGYSATTIRDIAKAVDMQSGSPFYHFKTKHDMLLAVVLEGMATITRAVGAAAAAGGTPREVFEAMLLAHLDQLLAEDGRHFAATLLHESHHLEAAALAELIEQKDAYEALWQKALRDLKRAGEIDRRQPRHAPVADGRAELDRAVVPPQRRPHGEADRPADFRDAAEVPVVAGIRSAIPGLSVRPWTVDCHMRMLGSCCPFGMFGWQKE